VVLKLFQLVRPTDAIFGKKDYQQCAVIRRMNRDLALGVRLYFAPTTREVDGLAMSSRNVFLTPEQRAAAPAIFAGLTYAALRFAEGERGATALREVVRAHVDTIPESRVDYIELCDAETLEPVELVERKAVLAVAVHVGITRLIDNIELVPRRNGLV
jgi:pantoate--beta-alanine ligase